MNPYIVSSFYKFVPLTELTLLREQLLAAMFDHALLGTIILAKEGINGSFSGSEENVRQFYHYLRAMPSFSDLFFQETEAAQIPFTKAKVKLRREIVTMGVDGVDPRKTPGEYLSPQEWNELINQPDVMLIDTRNDYEVYLGTFKNAINPKTENFRDFPAYVQTHLADKKDKKIAMCCTGGIRCEKSTAYLKQLGFKHVYQLKGGILNYLNSIPAEQSQWQGTCFVFDDRIAIEKE